MAKGDNQKLKMLYLSRIFMEETDDRNGLTMQQIIAKLKLCGVNADRKTLYLDFEELRHFGLDIISEQIGRNTYYYIGSREFELPELKLLVDSVQSAKFITEKKSNELIRKLETLVSHSQAKHLQRQVIVTGRIKAMNESIYYNVDKLHEAIGADRQIRFRYFQWNTKKEMELRRDGQWYYTSPWKLMWDDENYYLVAYDKEHKDILHYRVDKMLQITMLDDRREGQAKFKAFNLPKYTKSLFGMYGGELTRVTIEAENSMVGVMIDRFGKDIPIVKADKDHFRTSVDVSVSSQFFGWIFALGSKVKLVGPEQVVKQMKSEAKDLLRLYP
ncbi:MAG: WYL domain-containing protein [Lachnospiraceae bacterium]|nr:WYL domain-containing protein [Lachnospiraceae bacterium]